MVLNQIKPMSKSRYIGSGYLLKPMLKDTLFEKIFMVTRMGTRKKVAKDLTYLNIHSYFLN